MVNKEDRYSTKECLPKLVEGGLIRKSDTAPNICQPELVEKWLIKKRATAPKICQPELVEGGLIRKSVFDNLRTSNL